ncbi:MAG: hypothetical protein HC831_29870 [Chloroflexia bacterium]|nr:hypothetical protein [Chloroflexia bacterium]
MNFLRCLCLFFTGLIFLNTSYGAIYEQKNVAVSQNQSISQKPQRISIFKIMKLRKEFKKIKLRGNNPKSDYAGAAVCGFFAILFLLAALRSDVLSRILFLTLALAFGIMALVFLLRAAVNGQKQD